MKRIIRNFVLAMMTLLMTLSISFTANGQDYDLIIKNGRVMDPETNYDAVANIGIKDGKIAINAAFLKPENWVEKLGNKYEETMQDTSTGEFYTLENWRNEVFDSDIDFGGLEREHFH